MARPYKNFVARTTRTIRKFNKNSTNQNYYDILKDDDDEDADDNTFQSRQRNALKKVNNDKTSSPNFEIANSIYDCKSEEQLVKFYHAVCGSPPKSTWVQAITNKCLRGWPGLTAKNEAKYITVESATVKGHLDQKSQGLRSTKPKTEKKIANKSEIKIEHDTPLQEPNNEKLMKCTFPSRTLTEKSTVTKLENSQERQIEE
jgi:hypothetical protein